MSPSISTYYHYPKSTMSSISSLGSDKSFTLPFYPARKVDFVEDPVYSRLPRDDELYVMKAFARHARHCSSCARPYETHKKGGSLCPKGHQRALDVTQYLYNKQRETRSVVDRGGNRTVQVEIPANCDVVRNLLKAIERGLRLRRMTPLQSYDSTYHIPARTLGQRVQPDRAPDYQREPRYIRKPKLETAVPPPGYHSRRLRDEPSYYDDKRDTYRSGRDSSYQQPLYASARSFRRGLTTPSKDYWI